MLTITLKNYTYYQCYEVKVEVSLTSDSLETEFIAWLPLEKISTRGKAMALVKMFSICFSVLTEGFGFAFRIHITNTRVS